MSQRAAALLLMVASGFAGLGYQIVWTQQCALWLGHESAGVLAVVAAFFGGLAVGALLLGKRIESSARPLYWYAACELSIALWSLLLTVIMAPGSAWLLDITGVQPSPVWQWSVAFFGTFLLLLPATAAMGATLPAMERMTMHWQSGGRSIAALYASNTLGAVIGVLACAFWLVPELGLIRTAGFCMVLNIFCAVVALYLFRSSSVLIANNFSAGNTAASNAAAKQESIAGNAVLIRLALTGLLGIGYEVLVVRVLSQVDEDTVYTFAMLLAVYLVGSAIGAAIYQSVLSRQRSAKKFDIERLENRLLNALAACCLIGTLSLWGGEYIKTQMLQLFGASMSAALAAEAVLAAIAFGPPTVAMGALFSHLSARALNSGHSFGLALGVNTLGAASAPLIFGVLLFPSLGAKLALLAIVLGYIALISWSYWRKPAVWLTAAAALLVAIAAPRLAFIDIPDGGHIVSYREGVMAAVSVVEDAEGVARLRIDNRQQEGSSSSLRVDGRQALLPVLLHAAPRQVLFLGLGTGVTASSAALDPTLQVDAVELLPEVIAASHHFTGQLMGDRQLNDGADNPRLHLINADARRYVRASDRHYDVIISDNFHPARSGSGSLYTVEHFQAVRNRLAPNGIFCQWLPLHQLDLPTLRSIVKSFVTAYPNGWAILASNSLETPVLGLIGRGDERRSDDGHAQHFDVDALRRHLMIAAEPDHLRSFGIDDEFTLLGSFVAGPAALKHFATNAAANTDDHPVVAYRAPRITYAPDSLPRERLFQLLKEFSIAPADLIDRTDPRSARLAAYWQARNQFIESGRNVRAASDVRSMLAQVREPLLSVLRISPDFRPAYDPLLMMAARLAQNDMTDARALLSELVQIQPARQEAQEMLQRIGAVDAAQ